MYKVVTKGSQNEVWAASQDLPTNTVQMGGNLHNEQLKQTK